MRKLYRRDALRILAASTMMAAGARTARAQDLTPVKIGASIDDGLTPLLYAMQEGMFRDAGLDVTLQQSQSGAALAVAIAGGAVDFAKSALMSLVSAYDRGIRFKVVAPAAMYTTTHAPTDELLVLKDSKIKSLADINGKIVVVSALQSFDELATRASIDLHGGDSSSVTFMEMPFIAMPLALEQGRADMVSIGNPFLARALKSGKTRSFGDPYNAIGDRFLEAGWFATGDYAAKNPDVVRRFSAVMAKANTFANAHPDLTAPVLAKYSGIPTEVVMKMGRVTYAAEVLARDMQPAIDVAFRYKYIHQSFSATQFLV
jgi:NitT/TauT family transport system substrate-binding protein